MVSRIERSRQQVDDGADRRGSERVPCKACGETVAYYRRARVRVASVERPVLRVKCTRSGCRTETIITLDEITL